MKKIGIIYSYFKKYSFGFICLLLLSILVTACSYVLPLVYGKIIDYGIGQKDIKNLYKLIIIYIGSGIVKELISLFKKSFKLKFDNRIMINTKCEILLYYIYSKDEIDKSKYNLDTILKQDITRFVGIISSIILDSLINILSLITSVIVLLSIQKKLAVMVIMLQIGSLLFQNIFNKKLEKNSNMIRNSTITVVGIINEIVDNIKNIICISADKFLIKKYKYALKVDNSIQVKTMMTFDKIGVLMYSISLLMSSLVLLLGGIKVINGIMTLGMLISFMQYTGTFTQPIITLMSLPMTIYNNKASIDTILDILIKIQKQKQKQKDNIVITDVNKISLNNLTFGYEESKLIFDKANAVFNKGNIYFITGKSGVGKTTLIQLLLKQIIINEGILLDDIEISKLSLLNIQKLETWISQEPIIFNDTILNNLLLGRDISMERVCEVCRDMNILDYIESLSNKFYTLINECKDNLSVGQKHRLSLVRGLLQRTPILIIDEGTAGLDTETEGEIRDRLIKYCKDRIVIIITHSNNFIIPKSIVYEIKDGQIQQKYNKYFNMVLS